MTIYHSPPLLLACALLAGYPVQAVRAQSHQASSSNAVRIAAQAERATVQVRALGPRGQLLGTGSGFFVSSEGLLITNLHVIQGATALQIRTLAGEIFDVVFFVTADARRDLAVLKIPVENVTSLPLGSDSLLHVGSRVFVMGNPLGQTGTFSDGMVSARRMMDGVSILQITAPISPGSSGGPVMNEQGAVIGVATAMLEGGQNLNYAVPARYLRPLIATGELPQRFSRSLLPNSDARTPTSADRDAAREQLVTQIFEQQIIPRVTRVDSVAFSNNLVGTGNVFVGGIANLRDEEHQLFLSRGQYMVVGVCDNDCKDLDLRLYSPTGRLLQHDVRISNLPRFSVVLREPGTYTLKVTMTSCEAAPCYYAVKVYH